MWDCISGDIERRIKNEKDVCCITMNDTCSRIVFGKKNGELRVWEPNKRSQQPLRKIPARRNLEFGIDTKIQLTDSDTKAVILAGSVSIWDLDRACVLAVFTPDTPVSCVHVAYGGHALLLGLHDTTELVTLRPRGIAMTSEAPAKLHDVGVDSDFDEDEEEEDEEDEEEGGE